MVYNQPLRLICVSLSPIKLSALYLCIHAYYKTGHSQILMGVLIYLGMVELNIIGSFTMEEVFMNISELILIQVQEEYTNLPRRS